jgi:hypothetical protein
MTITLHIWYIPIAAVVLAWIWAFCSPKDYMEFAFNFYISLSITLILGLISVAYWLGGHT